MNGIDIDLNKFKFDGLYCNRKDGLKVLMFKHKKYNSINYLYVEESEENKGKFDIVFGSSTSGEDFYKLDSNIIENKKEKIKILKAYIDWKQGEINTLQKELNRMIDIVGHSDLELNEDKIIYNKGY